MPTISPRNGTALRYASRISLFFHAASSRVAVTAWPSFWATLRPPAGRARPSSSRPASCIVRVDAPRVRVSIRLPQALRAAAPQSTPLCSQKRRSSLRTIAVSNAGEISASGTQARRRTSLSTRSVWIGTPWRSSRVMSEGRCAAFTAAKLGSGAAPASLTARPRASASSSAASDSVHGPTSIAAFGASPKLSGAYIASTRVGGSANFPGLLRRTLYSTTCLPRGRYS